MSDGISRRDLIKGALIGAGALALPSTNVFAGPLTNTDAPGNKELLTPFNYQGVRLLEGMLHTQYQQTREYYYNLSNDSILKGFRKRAKLPAPGEDMGAWGSEDTAMVFGQWLRGMARMYKATGDVGMRDKAAYLFREWRKTFQADGTSYLPTLA